MKLRTKRILWKVLIAIWVIIFAASAVITILAYEQLNKNSIGGLTIINLWIQALAIIAIIILQLWVKTNNNNSNNNNSNNNSKGKES